MKIPLTEAQIIYLEEQHKAEHDGRIRDRIKAVLLNDGKVRVLKGSTATKENAPSFEKHNYKKLKDELLAENKAYEGLVYRLVSENIEEKIKNHNWEKIVFIGFSALNKAEENFIKKLKSEIDVQFAEMNTSNIYYAKKSIRKILRNISKYIKFSGKEQTAAELFIYFCSTLKNSGISIKSSSSLDNLFQAQIKKINKLIDTMHEDLQYDFRKELEKVGRF